MRYFRPREEEAAAVAEAEQAAMETAADAAANAAVRHATGACNTAVGADWARSARTSVVRPWVRDGPWTNYVQELHVAFGNASW